MIPPPFYSQVSSLLFSPPHKKPFFNGFFLRRDGCFSHTPPGQIVPRFPSKVLFLSLEIFPPPFPVTEWARQGFLFFLPAHRCPNLSFCHTPFPSWPRRVTQILAVFFAGSKSGLSCKIGDNLSHSLRRGQTPSPSGSIPSLEKGGLPPLFSQQFSFLFPCRAIAFPP